MRTFRISRDTGVWMYCGKTVDELLNCLRPELEADVETGEPSEITIETCEMTQEEIDKVPDFPGW